MTSGWKTSSFIALPNRAGGASWETPWITTRVANLVIWELEWSGGNGTFDLWGGQTLTGEGGLESVPVPLTSGVYGSESWPLVDGSSGRAILILKSPFAAMKLSYTSNDGTTFMAFAGTVELRT